jgi:hypothetical protein
VLVAVLIAITVPVPWFVRYALEPSGLNVTALGFDCAAIVAVSVLVAVLITDTVLPPLFVTYARFPLGLKVTPWGDEPTGMVLMMEPSVVFTTDTVLLVELDIYKCEVEKLADALIVATTGAVPALMAVKAAILPTPLAGKPIAGLLLVHT